MIRVGTGQGEGETDGEANAGWSIVSAIPSQRHSQRRAYLLVVPLQCYKQHVLLCRQMFDSRPPCANLAPMSEVAWSYMKDR